MKLFLLIILLFSQDPAEPDACIEPGDPWINWWDSGKMIVWWPCANQPRVERWVCLVDVFSPDQKEYSLLLRGEEGIGDWISPEISFPFGNWPGRWWAEAGTCYAEHYEGGRWVTRYTKEVVNGNYLLRDNPLKACIGVPLHLCNIILVPWVYAPTVVDQGFFVTTTEVDAP